MKGPSKGPFCVFLLLSLFLPLLGCTPQRELPLIVLMGQSNMSGRGTPVLEWSNPQVQIFGNDYQWHPASNPVDSGAGQVDMISFDEDAAHSPAPEFADLCAERYEQIGLIPCAKGGSTMSEWVAGQPLYETCMQRVGAAGGRVAAVLFYQGEGDAALALDGTPGRWADLFASMVASLHQRFGQVPIVFAQIAAFPDENASGYSRADWDYVQQQQEDIELDCVVMITTQDLSFGYVHFGNAEYDEIGRRFAEALFQLDCE